MMLNREEFEKALAVLCSDGLAPYKPISPPATMSACKDVLAIEWGASADLMPFVEELLPYQTRHYAATI